MNILKQFKGNNHNVGSTLVQNIAQKISNEAIGSTDITIQDTYTDDYDILSLHRQIAAKIKAEIQYKKPKMEKERDMYIEMAKNVKRPLDKQLFSDKASKLDREIKELGTRLETYHSNVQRCVEEYAHYQEATDAYGIQRRIDAIEEFLQHARHYADIKITRLLPECHLCDVCGFDLKEVDYVDGVASCPNCGTTVTKYIDVADERIYEYESKHQASGSVEGDDSRNFMNALRKFQGKDHDILPPTLFSDLDRYFKIIGFPSREHIMNLPHNEDGTKKGTSKQLMISALKEIGYPKLYDDCAFIAKEYWGWILPDLSAYEDIILHYYRDFQKVYSTVKGFERKSSLSTQVLLWLILYNLGFNFKKSDFRVVDTEDTIDYYRNVLHQCTQELGWKNISL